MTESLYEEIVKLAPSYSKGHRERLKKWLMEHSIEVYKRKNKWYVKVYKSVHLSEGNEWSNPPLKKGDYYTNFMLKGPIFYRVGKHTSVGHDYDINPRKDCGSGLHVANLRYVKERYPAYHREVLLICEVEIGDIVCVPMDTLGKIRVRRLKVIKAVHRKSSGIRDVGYKLTGKYDIHYYWPKAEIE